MGKAPGQFLVDLPQPLVVGIDAGGAEQAAGQGAVPEQPSEHLLAGKRPAQLPGRGLGQMGPQLGRGCPGVGKSKEGKKACMVDDRLFARLDAPKQDRQQFFLGQAVLPVEARPVPGHQAAQSGSGSYFQIISSDE